MITFKQFLEAREVKDIPQNNIREILTHINDPIISVKFALYCAEDCFQFNNEHTIASAQQCIDLIKKWLKNPQSVTNQKLRSATNDADTAWLTTTSAAANAVAAAANAAYAAAVNAYTAANVVANTVTNAVANAVNAFAYGSGHPYGTPEWNQMRDQKRQEYINKLKGMTTTRTNYAKHSEMLKGYDNTEEAIKIALDELEDLEEIGKDHFVYQDDNGKWVFDLGYDNILRAATKQELARLIYNDKYYLDALLRLYNANV